MRSVHLFDDALRGGETLHLAPLQHVGFNGIGGNQLQERLTVFILDAECVLNGGMDTLLREGGRAFQWTLAGIHGPDQISGLLWVLE